MKLFIVTWYDDGSSYNEHPLPRLQGVFESREIAESYCKKRFSRGLWDFPPHYEIEEIELNKDLS